MSTTVIFVILTFVFMLSLECSIRYFWWWIKVLHDDTLLKDLLIGIALCKTAFAGFACMSLIRLIFLNVTVADGPNFWFRLFFDIVLALGVWMNLRSHWFVSQNFNNERIISATITRLLIAIFVGLGLEGL